MGLAVGGGIAGIVALIIVIIVSAKLEQIEPGHVGVSVKKCGDAKIAAKPIPVGYYWRELFCEQVIEYPTSMQNLILAVEKEQDDSIVVTSSEGLNIRLDVALNFTLSADKVPSIYERWRAPIDDIAHRFVRQTIREALQTTFAKYTAEELYSTKKEVARVDAEKIIIDKLGPQGFSIAQFTINRLTPPDAVVQAINAKVAMIQDAQRSEQEVRKKEAQARQLVAEAKGQADASRAKAEGEAAAITLRAEAQAKANELLAKSVTPELIQYEAMRKWVGILPQVTSGATPMISVK
jgi:regulator of protease activity HflC (stomatin/prohibitin superfamily)